MVRFGIGVRELVLELGSGTTSTRGWVGVGVRELGLELGSGTLIQPQLGFGLGCRLELELGS